LNQTFIRREEKCVIADAASAKPAAELVQAKGEQLI